MSQDPYPPLRPQPPVNPPRRETPWVTILGAVLLGVLGIILLALIFGGDDGEPTGSSTPTAASSVGPSMSASASAGSSAAASAAPTSSASATALAIDSIVETSADGVALRAEPGLAGERLGSLALGSASFVVDGPSEADGYQWYLVSGLGLPPNTGCAGPLETDPYTCPVWFGWAASASESGEPWLTPMEPDCPAEPLTAEGLIIGRSNLQRLACFGSDPFTYRAFWPVLPDDGVGGSCAAQDEPSGWLLCQDTNTSVVAVEEGEENLGGIGIQVSIDPASGVTMPERGTWVELQVHLDDPAAQGCAEAAGALEEQVLAPEEYILFCRGQMVVESAAAVDGP